VETSLLRIFSLEVLGMLAFRQNRDLTIARLKVTENQQKKGEARSSYFPELKNQSLVHYTTTLEQISIPAGTFGSLPNVGFVPDHEVPISQGGHGFEAIGTTLASRSLIWFAFVRPTASPRPPSQVRKTKSRRMKTK
jgi:hypothetical protein